MLANGALAHSYAHQPIHFAIWLILILLLLHLLQRQAMFWQMETL